MTAKGEFRVFVGNLAPGVDNAALFRAFEQCGALSAKVGTDQRTGKPLGFGHVDFETQEKAREAAELMHGYELEDRILSVHVDKLYRGSKSMKVRRSGVAGAAATQAIAAAAAGSKSKKSPMASPRGTLTQSSSGGKGWEWLSNMRSSFKAKGPDAGTKSLAPSRSSSHLVKGGKKPGLNTRSKSMSLGSMEVVSPSTGALDSSRSQKSAKSDGWG